MFSMKYVFSICLWKEEGRKDGSGYMDIFKWIYGIRRREGRKGGWKEGIRVNVVV